MKNKLFMLIRAFISFSLIGLLLWFLRNDIPSIIETIKGADAGFALLGFSIYLTAVLLMSYRMLKVISVQGIRLKMKEAVSLTFIGFFFNNFLPTSIGGDLAKAYYAGKKFNKKAPAFAGIFMDRFLAMIPFTLIPAITLLFYQHKAQNRPLTVAVYCLLGSCLIFFILLLNKRALKRLAFILEPLKGAPWYGKIKGGYNSLNLYGRHKRVIFLSFVTSLIAQSMWVVSVYFFSRAVHADNAAPPWIFFIIVPIVGVMSMIPSINGLGVRESGFVYLLKDYMTADKAFAVSILVLASLAAFGIIGGVIYTLRKNMFDFKMEDTG